MNDPAPSIALILQLLVLSLISFGGIPAVLPDLRAFVVTANGWLTDREFANCFARVRVLPGPSCARNVAAVIAGPSPHARLCHARWRKR